MVIKRQPKDIFKDPGLFCSSVLLMLVDTFGAEVVNWEPETIYAAMKERFGVEMNNLLADKINAALSLLSSDIYYQDLTAFNTTNRVLSFRYADFDEFVPAPVDDTAWGVTEVSLIVGKEDQTDFNEDVKRYVGLLLETEGITRPPEILSFATFSTRDQDERTMALAQDPAMASMYETRQIQEIEKINKLVQDNLVRLMQQIAELPLEGAPDIAEKATGLIAQLEGADKTEEEK